jgi:chromosome segregation ATPase
VLGFWPRAQVKRLLLKLDGTMRRCEALEDSEEALRTKATAAEGRAKQVEGVITSFEEQLRQGAEEAAALKKRLTAAEHDAEALLAQVTEQEAARKKVEEELLAKLKKSEGARAQLAAGMSQMESQICALRKEAHARCPARPPPYQSSLPIAPP